MPHLDICTFVVQYNWTCITFLSLYMIISVNYLPKIGKILHIRIRKITDKGTELNENKINSNSSISVLKNSLSI